MCLSSDQLCFILYVPHTCKMPEKPCQETRAHAHAYPSGSSDPAGWVGPGPYNIVPYCDCLVYGFIIELRVFTCGVVCSFILVPIPFHSIQLKCAALDNARNGDGGLPLLFQLYTSCLYIACARPFCPYAQPAPELPAHKVVRRTENEMPLFFWHFPQQVSRKVCSCAAK